MCMYMCHVYAGSLKSEGVIRTLEAGVMMVGWKLPSQC